jgi:hypothetical protein
MLVQSDYCPSSPLTIIVRLLGYALVSEVIRVSRPVAKIEQFDQVTHTSSSRIARRRYYVR